MEIDLLSVAGYAGSQPNEQFAWLRTNAPVYRHPEPDGPGFWAITRYDDVKAVGRDHQTFSSQPTIMIADGSDEPSPFADHTMLLVADPPLHTRMRRLVSREFTPRAATALQPRIRQLAALIIDQVAGRGECDLVADIAGEMPSLVIAEMLGISHDEGRRLYHCTETIHASTEVASREERGDAIMTMFMSAQAAYADKRANPTNDLGSLIAHGAVDGELVDAIDFFLWFMLLVDAGGDTTRNLVGGGLQALFEHPDQLALLRSDIDAHLSSAREEMLRWVSPVVYMRRTATTDTEIAGQAVEAGDKVVVYYGAATATHRHSTNPTGSTSLARPIPTLRSGAVARTTASVRTSPDSRSTQSCANFSPDSPTSNPPVPWSGWARTSSSVQAACRCGSALE